MMKLSGDSNSRETNARILFGTPIAKSMFTIATIDGLILIEIHCRFKERQLKLETERDNHRRGKSRQLREKQKLRLDAMAVDQT